MKLSNVLLLIIPAAMLLSSCGTKVEAVPTEKSTAIPVKVMALESAAGAAIEVSGQFTTDDEVNLSFKSGGIINKMYVKEGDAVREGQLLATLNMTEINTQVAQYQIALEKATRDYQRVQKLYNDSVYTLEQLQNAKSGLDLAKQQLSASEFNKSYSEIRANRSGYVLHKMASEGQLASAGATVLQINGAQAGNWMLKAGVSDKDWAAIKTNDKAVISLGAEAGKTYEGIVTHKSESADPASGSFTIDIKFKGAKPGALAAGMYGRAVIVNNAAAIHGTTKNIAIPYDALLDGDGSTGYVFVTNDNKTATKLKVEVAGVEKDRVIISKGLEGAQSLIIMGSAYLNDKSPITIN